MIRVIALLLVALSDRAAAAEVAAVRPDRWLPDHELIETLERAAVLPEGAAAIETYVRYYTGWRTAVNGHRLVFGTIISPDLPLFGRNKPTPSIRIVEPNAMPDLLARNCGIIMLEVNVDTDESVAKCYQP